LGEGTPQKGKNARLRKPLEKKKTGPNSQRTLLQKKPQLVVKKAVLRETEKNNGSEKELRLTKESNKKMGGLTRRSW